jgi:GNAT superfamily N-acetyltransferase
MSAGRLDREGFYDVPAGKIAAVVTSLEMRAPPAGSPPPAPPGVSLAHLRDPDPDRYLALFHAIGTPWLWFSRLKLPRDALVAILRDPAVEVWTVRQGDCEIGLVELDFRPFPDVELAFFGLVPEWTGRGLGRWMMGHAIGRAFAGGAKRFWVHTCTLDHPGALAFYMRAGFVPFARCVEIADDPRLTGLLPRDAAPHVPLIGPPA